MDELKIIFWIIIGLVYLLSRRKKSQPPPVPQRPAESHGGYEPPAPPKASTFEELLREIEGMKKPGPQPAPSYNRPPAKRESDYVDYDDNLEDEKKVLEDSKYDYHNQDKIYDVYEEAKKQAFVRPSLEETVKLEDTIVRFKQFKGYQTETRKNLVEDYLKELKDPAGFKKAFIMSEILKKRF